MGKYYKKRPYFRCDYSSNPSEEFEGAVCIPLNKGFHTIIDADDFDKIQGRKWTLKKGYATNYFVGGQLHRVILQAPEGLMVDHINGNPLDNRKGNLRVCTVEQNSWNSRKLKNSAMQYKGISLHAEGKYQASIRLNKKLHYIGLFETPIAAAAAYDIYAMAHRGEYAKLNF